MHSARVLTRIQLLHRHSSRALPSQTQITRQLSTSSSPSPDTLSPQPQQPEIEPHPQPQPPKRGRPSKPPSSPSYPIPASTALHSSLPTFLHHAQRTSLSPTSTVFVGTHYEYTVAQALAAYQFDLTRIGGRSDQGIDLLGTWTLPGSTTPSHHKVFVQCKALTRTPTSVLIRELEGAFSGAPAGWRGEGVIGLLATCGPATKGIREAMGRSRWPMGFVCCSKEGEVRQMLWNWRAEEEGLAGLGVGMRYVGDEKRLVLTWNGRHIAAGVGGEGEGKVKL
ncbi:hypothetical protein B0T22DRAFT_425570 [Podospora appendiculata]|uniref:Required for respiratory growth protein 7, mitochondrial n=1 Tax=Podospora appendiculata TaxID=314037 RepID=A0AAE1CC04_9PEZI|nr:hypothetical protein B0T22DRAFT_425570 [Podospora appendiculata]